MGKQVLKAGNHAFGELELRNHHVSLRSVLFYNHASRHINDLVKVIALAHDCVSGLEHLFFVDNVCHCFRKVLSGKYLAKFRVELNLAFVVDKFNIGSVH